MEDKGGNGDYLYPTEWAYFENIPLLPPLSKKWAYFWKLASVATSVRKVGLFMKTHLCGHHVCPESGLIYENLPLSPPLSGKWAYLWEVAYVVITSVQKVGLFLKTRLSPPLSWKWAYLWKLASAGTSVQKLGLFLKTRLCRHLCPESGLIYENSLFARNHSWTWKLDVAWDFIFPN